MFFFIPSYMKKRTIGLNYINHRIILTLEYNFTVFRTIFISCSYIVFNIWWINQILKHSFFKTHINIWLNIENNQLSSAVWQVSTVWVCVTISTLIVFWPCEPRSLTRIQILLCGHMIHGNFMLGSSSFLHSTIICL